MVKRQKWVKGEKKRKIYIKRGNEKKVNIAFELVSKKLGLKIIGWSAKMV
jgi:hypothetical protein